MANLGGCLGNHGKSLFRKNSHFYQDRGVNERAPSNVEISLQDLDEEEGSMVSTISRVPIEQQLL